MIDFISHMTEWHWLVFGVVLIVAEIIAPGTFLLWPGIAAVLIGLLIALVPAIAWTTCVAAWAVLSVVLVAGFVFYRKGHPDKVVSLLNRRGEQYVGERYVLEKPIMNGKGEVRVGDSVWKALSTDDLAAGASVVVTAVEGTSLRVMPVERN